MVARMADAASVDGPRILHRVRGRGERARGRGTHQGVRLLWERRDRAVGNGGGGLHRRHRGKDQCWVERRRVRQPGRGEAVGCRRGWPTYPPRMVAGPSPSASPHLLAGGGGAAAAEAFVANRRREKQGGASRRYRLSATACGPAAAAARGVATARWAAPPPRLPAR
jgi:hypothetical protein